MKINIIFLIIAIIISVISKALQFIFYSKIGDIVILFATPFFVLAIAFSINAFNEIWSDAILKSKAILILMISCIIILSFQIMMMLVVNSNNLGFIMLIPLIISSVFLFNLIMKLK